MSRVPGAGLLVAGAIVASSCGLASDRGLDTAEDALACAQEAIGGRKALASVVSLVVNVESTPDAADATGRPVASEFTFAWPDSYRQVNRLEMPRGGVWETVKGLSRAEPFVNVANDATRTAPPDAQYGRGIEQTFAHLSFVWLLRETPVVPLVWSGSVGVDEAPVRLTATGPDNFNLTLLLDADTCRPRAVSWERPPNFGDAMAGRSAVEGMHVERRDLLDYATFDGIRLPRHIRLSTDGTPRAVQTIVSVRVNPPLPGDVRRLPLPANAR